MCIACSGSSWILPMYSTNSQFIILLVHTDNAGNFPHDGHSLHDADSVIKMSLLYEIGDDHDFGNAVVATLLYHLCDADIVVAQDTCNIGQCSGAVLHLKPQEESALRLLHIQYGKFLVAVTANLAATSMDNMNVDHPAFQALEQAVTADPEKAKKYAQLLYDQALLIAGLPLDDPSGYTDLVCELMK